MATGASPLTKYTWTTTVVAPADILDAVRTITGGSSWELSLVPEDWVEAEQYLEWSQAGRANDNPLGWEVGLTYAKRAVCRRIDGLLLNNYFGEYLRAKYPAKIELLKAIGIRIPNLVQNWIIQGRNRVEHDYSLADKQHAVDAEEIAGLFLQATADEVVRKVALVAGGPVHHHYGGEFPGIDTDRLNALGMSTSPVIFFDGFAEPVAVKILDPENMEIRQALTAEFEKAEIVEFAQRMRQFTPSFGLARQLFPAHLLDGNRAIIDAFKKRAQL